MKTFVIIFSLLLIAINLFCIKWILKRILNLATLISIKNLKQEAITKDSNSKFKDMLSFLVNKSKNEKQSKNLLFLLILSLIPSVIAFVLFVISIFTVKDAILSTDLVLFTINVVIFIIGKVYTVMKPLDKDLLKELKVKKENSYR